MSDLHNKIRGDETLTNIREALSETEDADPDVRARLLSSPVLIDVGDVEGEGNEVWETSLTLADLLTSFPEGCPECYGEGRVVNVDARGETWEPCPECNGGGSWVR